MEIEPYNSFDIDATFGLRRSVLMSIRLDHKASGEVGAGAEGDDAAASDDTSTPPVCAYEGHDLDDDPFNFEHHHQEPAVDYPPTADDTLFFLPLSSPM